jgi:predicted RNA-binding protein YlxR (DUF448 family)
MPQRTCIACREVLSKRTLVRLVRTKDGTEIDPTGKRPGRGAYLHDRRSCWETALKDETILERALKTTLTPEERERLRAYSLTLPE